MPSTEEERWPMRFDAFSFGSIRIDEITYDCDVVIDGGSVRKRKRRAPKKLRNQFCHLPLSTREEIPWKCERLVVGTGAYGRMPVTEDVRQEAGRRKIELLILPTTEAIEALRQATKQTNAILHVCC